MKKTGSIFSALFLLANASAYATEYAVPPANESLIGQNQITNAGYDDTVVTVAKRYDIGFNAIQNANPHLDLTQPLPSGAPLIIPTQHLLPNEARKGIVINLPEMRGSTIPCSKLNSRISCGGIQAGSFFLRVIFAY